MFLITSGRVHGYMCIISSHSPEIGSRCCLWITGVYFGCLTLMTQTDSRALLLQVLQHVSMASAAPSLRVVSCRHVCSPLSPCQGHPFVPRSVTYSTPLHSSSPRIVFLPDICGKYRYLTPQIRTDDGAMLIGEYTRVAHLRSF